MVQKSLKDVLLIGSTGQLAPVLIRHLACSPQLTLTVLTRSQTTCLQCDVRYVSLQTPYKADELAGLLKGKDVVINLIPPGQLETHKLIIDLCIKEGVRRYIPPDFGARSDQDSVAQKVPVVAMKKRVREYLQSKEDEGLTWTSVICGGFMDSGLINGFLGLDLKQKKAKLYDDGKHDLDLTVLSDVGEAVKAILERPFETENRYVHVNTFYTSQSKILEILENQLGRFEVSRVKAQNANKEGSARIKRGDFGGVKDSLMGVMASGLSGVNGEGKDNVMLLGRVTRDTRELEEFMRKIVKGGEGWNFC